MSVYRFMQNLVSKIPIMVVEGNHEIEEQAENQTFVAYSSRFAFPSEESGSSSTFYYSFNAGGIHFVMLGAYIAYDKSGNSHFRLVFLCFSTCSPSYIPFADYYIYLVVCFFLVFCSLFFFFPWGWGMPVIEE